MPVGQCMNIWQVGHTANRKDFYPHSASCTDGKNAVRFLFPPNRKIPNGDTVAHTPFG